VGIVPLVPTNGQGFLKRHHSNYILFEVAILVSLFMSNLVMASSNITSKLLLGPAGFDETLSGTGDFQKRANPKREPLSWSLDAEVAEVQTTDDNGNPLIEHNDTFDGGVDYVTSSWFGAGAEYTYAMTPEESLVNSGPEFHISEKFKLADVPATTQTPSKTKSKDKDDEKSIKIKEGVKIFRYLQTFNSSLQSKKGVTYPLIGYNTLRQTSAELFTTLDIFDGLTVEYNFSYYFYDRNVASFLQYLNSSVAATLGAGGFGSSVTGFPMASHDLTLTIDLIGDWSTELECIDDIQVVDLSSAWTMSGIIYRDLGSWKFGLGYEYETSEILTTDYVVISAEYSF
jgi:hypothetical protein